LSWRDIELKFTDCARQAKRIPEEKAQQAFAAIQRLEALDDVAEIIELLT
jgi:hypothetical protein